MTGRYGERRAQLVRDNAMVAAAVEAQEMSLRCERERRRRLCWTERSTRSAPAGKRSSENGKRGGKKSRRPRKTRTPNGGSAKTLQIR